MHETAWLGFGDLGDKATGYGMPLYAVDDDGPAAQAGIMNGDVVLYINEKPTRAPRIFYEKVLPTLVPGQVGVHVFVCRER